VQIIVLGMHRSGTSTVTRLINMMGAYFGAEGVSLGFSDENPKGFWERRDVVNINDAILSSNGLSWYMPLGDADIGVVSDVALNDAIDFKIKTLVLDMDSNRPWVMKDPRMCLTFKYWRDYLELPVIVVVNRSPVSVAKSLATRNGFSIEYGIALWELYTAEMLASIGGMKCVYMEYEELLAAPYSGVTQLYEKLQSFGVSGMRLPSEQEVNAFVDVRLNRSGLSDNKDFLNASQIELLDKLKCAENKEFNYKISESSIKLMREYMREKKTFLKLVEVCSSHVYENGSIAPFDDAMPAEIERAVEGIISLMGKQKSSYDEMSINLKNAHSEIDNLKSLFVEYESKVAMLSSEIANMKSSMLDAKNYTEEIKTVINRAVSCRSFRIASRISKISRALMLRRCESSPMENLEKIIR